MKDHAEPKAIATAPITAFIQAIDAALEEPFISLLNRAEGRTMFTQEEVEYLLRIGTEKNVISRAQALALFRQTALREHLPSQLQHCLTAALVFLADEIDPYTPHF